MTLRTSLGQFSSRIDNIPCLIEVTHYLHQPPMGRWADNSNDAAGYTEVEFDVLDSRGRPAEWLERKVTQKDRSRIEAEAAKFMQQGDDE
jgi:hypothetical protein